MAVTTTAALPKSPGLLAGAKKALRRLFRRALPAGASGGGHENPTGDVTAAGASASLVAHPYGGVEAKLDVAWLDIKDAGNNQTGDKIISTNQAHLNGGYDTTATDSTMASAVAMNPLEDEDKENQPPPSNSIHKLTQNLADLKVAQANGDTADTTTIEETPVLAYDDPAVLAERAEHLRFIGEALDMARLALRTNETPVGCVLVHNGQVIARGMNATNVTRNGTRHAELMAICALLSHPRQDGPRTTCLKPKVPPPPKQERAESDEGSDTGSVESEWTPPDEGNEDGSKGHLYPYGQKLHPAPRVDRSIIQESILYVTVEPCVMCASLLRQLGIKKVYFGAVNDKFGGTGGVFSIHANSLPISNDGQTASAHPQPKPIQYPDGGGSLGTSFPLGGGDGGNVEPGYEIEGGWGRDEAVALLRRFYVQENGRAPVPRKKEGRAARLAAMMEKDGSGVLSESAEDQEHAGEENELMEFNSPMKENVDPAGGSDDKPRHGGLRESGSPVKDKKNVLRDGENHV